MRVNRKYYGIITRVKNRCRKYRTNSVQLSVSSNDCSIHNSEWKDVISVNRKELNDLILTGFLNVKREDYKRLQLNPDYLEISAAINFDLVEKKFSKDRAHLFAIFLFVSGSVLVILGLIYKKLEVSSSGVIFHGRGIPSLGSVHLGWPFFICLGTVLMIGGIIFYLVDRQK